MAKIMLVEDDKNLSAIYKDRLLAEGYDIVAAHDGEEALALAVKEKPDLIIADVMMPKISGFDMLDILRSTPETKNTKVIMMTALSQSENQQRATQLGADKYLVKSQVTLDDVARTVKEVLDGTGPAPAVAATDSTVSANPTPAPTPPAPMPTMDTILAETTPTPTPAPVSNESFAPAPAVAATDSTVSANPTPAPMPTMDTIPAETTVQEKQEIENEIEKLAVTIPTEVPNNVAPTPQATLEAPSPTPPAPQTPTPQPTIGERKIEPLNNPNDKPDIMALYEKEMAMESGTAPTPPAQGQDSQPQDPHSISL